MAAKKTQEEIEAAEAAKAAKKQVALEKAEAKKAQEKVEPKKGDAPVKAALKAMEAAVEAVEKCYNEQGVPPCDRVNFARDYAAFGVSNLTLAVKELADQKKEK